MQLIYNPIFKAHETGMHPENPKRLEALDIKKHTSIPFDESVLTLIHPLEYIQKVKKYSRENKSLSGETHTSEKTYEAAVYAANATILAAERNDFAVVRPPGHHAQRDHASGFCVFNNVAIAAQHLVNQGKKVLIFDFDGHLGDGTTDIFYDSDQVMYWSIHQFPAFPNRGLTHEIGIGKGKGYTINVPLPPHSGDDIFFDAVQYTMPIAKQFDPDVLAVSAGFDAHQYDLLLELRLSLGAFYKIGQILNSNFNNLFGTLEGGYNIEYLPKCLYSFIAGINDMKNPYLDTPTETDIKIWDEYELRLQDLLIGLKPYWKI